MGLSQPASQPAATAANAALVRCLFGYITMANVPSEGTGSSGIALATASVLEVKCEPMAAGSVPIKGYDFNLGIDYEKLLQSYKQTGFQARNFGLAADEINRMVSSAFCNQ